MKYLLLVHHNEEAFNEIPEDRRKEMLTESIQLCHQLKSENQALSEQQSNLMSERASLMQKNDLARTRVEAMIMRLKSMEQEYGQ